MVLLRRAPVGLAGAVALLSLVSCFRHRLVIDPPPRGAQALSLLGDTLWSIRFPSMEGQVRVRRLVEAQRRARTDPGDQAAQLLLGRRTAEMGRFREALEIYQTAIDADATDARLWRRQGELLLLLREPDRAADRLEQAVARAKAHPSAKEFLESDDGGLVGTSILHGSYWLLGVAHYVRGDLRRSLEAFGEAARTASNADEAANTAVWLFFLLHQHGRRAEAAEIVRAFPADAPVISSGAEQRLLLALRGDVSYDSLRRETLSAAPETENLYRYGLAVGLMSSDESTGGEMLRDLVRLGAWGNLVAVAAEAELARRAAPCPGPLPRLPAERRWNRCRTTKMPRPS